MDFNAQVLMWIPSAHQQPDVTLTFDLQNQGATFPVSCIEIVQAVHETSW